MELWRSKREACDTEPNRPAGVQIVRSLAGKGQRGFFDEENWKFLEFRIAIRDSSLSEDGS
jgi:hypothetical protein